MPALSSLTWLSDLTVPGAVDSQVCSMCRAASPSSSRTTRETPVGALPAFDVDLPYWPETSDVVAAVDAMHGIEIDLLRLIGHEKPRPHGGAVTYLVQVRTPAPGHDDQAAVSRFAVRPPARQERSAAATTDPLRPPYAEPGGPRASLAWASAVLGPVRAVQQRTWNLSAIWRLTRGRETLWLKQLPDFLRRETAVLTWFAACAPQFAPPLVAAGSDGRQILAHVEGRHSYDVPLLERADRRDADAVLHAWAARWRRDVPGCEPLRAIELLRPVAALEAAATFARFLTGIEAAERCYHERDVRELLDAAVAARGRR